MNKYKAVKTNGYASKKDAKRAAELKLMEKARLISWLQEQVKYPLIPSRKRSDGRTELGCTYTADFTYFLPGGFLVVEDVKGIKTDAYIIKRKLMLFIHGIEILET